MVRCEDIDCGIAQTFQARRRRSALGERSHQRIVESREDSRHYCAVQLGLAREMVKERRLSKSGALGHFCQADATEAAECKQLLCGVEQPLARRHGGHLTQVGQLRSSHRSSIPDRSVEYKGDVLRLCEAPWRSCV